MPIQAIGGRPMPRNAQIRLRLTDEEKANIEARAKAQDQKPAEFVRDLALYGQTQTLVWRCLACMKWVPFESSCPSCEARR